MKAFEESGEDKMSCEQIKLSVIVPVYNVEPYIRRCLDSGGKKMAGQQNQDVNQLLKVRREKLQELQENGKDPFQITK